MAIREITGALTMITIFVIMFFFAVSVMDPFYQSVQAYPMGGMAGSVDGIHAAVVQYMFPIGIASILIVTVLYILNRERQTVR